MSETNHGGKAVTSEEFCKLSIEKMLKRSQTKVIFPVITLGTLREHIKTGKTRFSDLDVRKSYAEAVAYMKTYLGHELHIGGKYYDAYSSRNLPKYGVFKVIGNQEYELRAEYGDSAQVLVHWIPERAKSHIEERLGIVPRLGMQQFRAGIAQDHAKFAQVIDEYSGRNPANFEIFSFAVIKVHLEKFACKIYRDTRTAAHDKGVDLSTNFGVVYQIKKLKVASRDTADDIYAELKVNFDSQRLNEGNIVLIIDDISKDVKKYLVNMKIQSISKNDVLKLAEQLDDAEDREKVLRIVYEEFKREYASDIL